MELRFAFDLYMAFYRAPRPNSPNNLLSISPLKIIVCSRLTTQNVFWNQAGA